MDIVTIIIQITVLLFAVIIHEVAHGYVAFRLGDPTAKYAGRLTLNPLPHLDLFMSVLLPAFLIFSGAGFSIGGAKPVPVNPSYFKNYKRDIMLVSFAGPASNIALAIISIILLVVAVKVPIIGNLGGRGLFLFLQYGIMINTILAVFNLIPIPPLDGSKILMGFLPNEMANKYASIAPYGMFIIIILLMTGILQNILMPVLFFVQVVLKALI